MSGEQRPSYLGVIERIVEHDPSTRSLFLRLPAGGGLRFVPGQFISLAVPLGEAGVIRPYTIASDPGTTERLEIVLDLVPGGPASSYVFSRQVGDELKFTGPFGLFTLERPPTIETIFVAHQTAIAPIRPMLHRALAAPADQHASASVNPALHLLHGADTPTALLYRAEFVALAESHPQLRFDPILANASPQWTGLTGALINHLRKLYVEADERRDRQFYLCGVGQPVLEMRDLLRNAGYPRRAVLYEKW